MDNLKGWPFEPLTGTVSPFSEGNGAGSGNPD